MTEATIAAVTVGLFAVLLRSFGVKAWPFGVMLFCALYMWNNASLNQAERYATPLVIGALILVMRRLPIVAGLALVAASTFWIPALAVTILPIFSLARPRDRLPLSLTLLFASAGVALAMTVSFGKAICVELLGSWASYERGNYTSTSLAGGHHFALPFTSTAYYFQSGLIFLAACNAIVWGRRAPPGRDVALAWSIASTVVIFALGKPFLHYFLCSYAPLVLLLTLEPWDPNRLRTRVLGTGVALFAVVTMVAVLYRDSRKGERETLHAMEYTGSLIRIDFGPGAVAVLPWEVYLSSEARPPSRLFMVRRLASARANDDWTAVPIVYADAVDRRYTKIDPPPRFRYSCGNADTEPLRVFAVKPLAHLNCVDGPLAKAAAATNPRGKPIDRSRIRAGR